LPETARGIRRDTFPARTRRLKVSRSDPAEIDLAFWHLCAFGPRDLPELTYFVCEIHDVHHKPVLMGSDGHQAFFFVEHSLRNGNPAGFLQGLGHQTVGFLSTLRWR
jgi:hypothetical protein